MRCPVCKIDMAVVEHNKVELDYCVQCSGVWFDSGELEILFEVMKEEGIGLPQTDPLNLLKAESAEKKLRCPICGQKMKKALVDEESKVLIDICPQGEGLWFDGGELGRVITQLAGRLAGGTDSQVVVSFLVDVFKAKDGPTHV